ncbi:MAG: LTA synthase family protein, partial [Clostridiales bacterium]|nr:LTA synthase family protein [Clostridiales bacterium]
MKEKFKNSILSNILFLTFVLTSLINSFLLRAFTVKNYISLKPILADIVIILIIGVFGFLIKNPKKRFAYYLPWTIIFTALCAANSLYYTQYQSFLSISLLSTASQLGGVMDAVTESIFEFKDLIFFWSIPALIGVYIFLKRKKGYFEQVQETQVRRKAAKSCAIVTLVCTVLFAINLTGTDLSRLTKQWNREYVLSRFGLYTYQISDTISSVKAKLNVLFGYEENKEAFENYYLEQAVENADRNKTNEYTNMFEGKNVLTIHAESIQQFCLDTYFNGEALTPNLNKLVSEGLYFSNFYSQESVGTSSDTEFTFSSSLMPASSGTVAINYWDREYVTIQKLLKEKGYYTFSMHGNNGSYWNRMNFHASFGYDKFFNYDTDYEIDETIGLGLSDKSFFRQSVSKIKSISNTSNNFYGNLIMLTNHTPFTSIEEVSDLKLTFDYQKYNEETGEYEMYSAPFLEGTKLGSYLKSVHYADEAIGQLMNDLETQGLLDDTVIVIYGDHDARIKDDYYEAYYNYNPFTEEYLSSSDDGYIPVDDFSYNINRKVPLIIWSKDSEYKPKEITKVMGMYDVLPTLGNMLGFENQYAMGTDIFSLANHEENFVTFPNGNFITDTVYYNAQSDEYFDLTNYENVTANASCNQIFKNFTPEQIFGDEFIEIFKIGADDKFSEDSFKERTNNEVVDEEYIKKYSETSETKIVISNAIIYY